jgi:dolichyl-phosphate mannosyltransferase polypeptide 3
MTKAYETVIYVLTASAIYFALSVGVIPTSNTFHDEILPVIPWWGLITFGCYALFSLGYGVFTLQDKEDKYYELKDQIEEAKTFLKGKGVDC